VFGLDDVIRKHPLAAIGLVAIAITADRERRKRRTAEGAGVRGGVKTVVKLCLEAQGEAEADIVCGLAEVAINDVFGALRHPAPDARHAAARAAVHRYAKRAHRRSARHARDASHHQRRYAQHMAALETRLSEHHAAAADEHKSTFEHALSALHEVKASPPEPAPAGAARSRATTRPLKGRESPPAARPGGGEGGADRV
jgi:hypothetical protein